MGLEVYSELKDKYQGSGVLTDTCEGSEGIKNPSKNQ
jgi:hypothetical protein